MVQHTGRDAKQTPAPLNPATKKPLKAEDLYPIFARELCRQELNQTDTWIDIPEQVREKYKFYRSTPLVRAYELEAALGTPAHIYFKNESVSPMGSHKLNSAIPQAYYNKEEGVKNVTTETGAGQWGASLAYAASMFGLESAVYQVKISYEQKPYRKSIMRVFGSQVTPSPSMSTRAGKDILTKTPNHQGSLGTAISEAIELARTTPDCKYTLGSVLSHVTLHQTIIGLEAEKQMAKTGEYPDIVIACFGGGSNFGGISFPFMRHNFTGERHTRFIAAEPDSCPKLTRGVFRYDYGDESGYAPLLPMFTLGHNFRPANIHAGGLRYHGAGVIVSQLLKDGLMEAVDIPPVGILRSRNPVRTHRRHHSGTRILPRHSSRHPRGQKVHRNRRGESNPVQSIRPRPHRHDELRQIFRRRPPKLRPHRCRNPQKPRRMRLTHVKLPDFRYAMTAMTVNI